MAIFNVKRTSTPKQPSFQSGRACYNRAVLLAIDVGNTNIVVGLHDRSRWLGSWRAATDPSRMADEYAVLLAGFFRLADATLTDVSAVALSSVVPSLTLTFEELARRYCHSDAIVVGTAIKTGVKILYDNPREVGADRIANAVATFKLYGGPAIVVDFGTATTFDALSADGEYVGGAIAPGLNVAADALFAHAARLFRVELKPPSAAIGRNTGSSVQSGVIFGYVGLIEGLIKRFLDEMGPAKVIATGGLAEVIAGLTPMVNVIDPMLTLEGLRLIYELNRVPVAAGASS
jgi:type III pantothenate kinase